MTRMMMLAVAGLLMGCAEASGPVVSRATSGQAQVTGVVVRAAQLSVQMSDGARCVMARPETAKGSWSGVTEGCGYALPFDVVFRAAGEPAARFLIEENPGVEISNGTVGARAEVYIRDVDGQRKQFVQPLGPGVRITTPG